MKIYAIRNGETNYRYANKTNANKAINHTRLINDGAQGDTVSFKGKNTVAGAGIGAILGLGGLGLISLLSGGAAAPIAYGIYAATMGTAGGMLGNALDEIDEEEKKQNKG